MQSNTSIPKKLVKKTLRFSAKGLLYFIIFLLVYLCWGFCLSRITVDKEPATTDEIAIYIKTNGVHTDVIVPVKNEICNWTKDIRFSNTHLTDSSQMQWLAMGWGDRGFYLETPTWADLKVSTAFKAAFALSRTAMHTTYYSSLHENNFCKKIMISKMQYQRLVQFIREGFQFDKNGQPILIITNANYNNADAFYEATGRYSLFKTCNSWANAALKSCGQKACLWTAFDTGIFLKYE
jgi:uncharacterized protein (TIGR02117 family)